MLTVRPEIVDADVIDIIVNSNFKYNPRATTKTVSELETLVRVAIITHDSTYLSGFDSIFRHSVLATDIDSAESSILSNITTVKLRKTLTPTLGQSKGYTVEFGDGNHSIIHIQDTINMVVVLRLPLDLLSIWIHRYILL